MFETKGEVLARGFVCFVETVSMLAFIFVCFTVAYYGESVLCLVDRAVVLVIKAVANERTAKALAADEALQAKLLGVAHADTA